MSDPTALESLDLARKQLERVRLAWVDPTDWDDLSLYGFYCLENAVAAAARHVGTEFRPTHPSKLEAARKLHDAHGLPDVSELLYNLNTARKAAVYGDIAAPELDAEQVATAIDEFVDAVASLMEGK